MEHEQPGELSFCMGLSLREDYLNTSLELCYGPVQPLIFLLISVYSYHLFLSDDLRYATSGMQLVYFQLVLFFKDCNCYLRPEGLIAQTPASPRWVSLV